MSLRFKCNVSTQSQSPPPHIVSILIPLVQLTAAAKHQHNSAVLTVNLLVDEFLARFAKKFSTPVQQFLKKRNLDLQALLPTPAGMGGPSSTEGSNITPIRSSRASTVLSTSEGELPQEVGHDQPAIMLGEHLPTTKLAPLGIVERLVFPEDPSSPSSGDSSVGIDVDVSVNGDDPLECFTSLTPTTSSNGSTTPGSSSVSVSIFFSAEFDELLFRSVVGGVSSSSLHSTPLHGANSPQPLRVSNDSTTPTGRTAVATSLHYSTPTPRSARGGSTLVRQDDQVAISLVQQRGLRTTTDLNEEEDNDEAGEGDGAHPYSETPTTYSLPYVPRPPRNSSHARGPAASVSSMGGEASGRASGGGRRFMGASQVVPAGSNPGSRATSPLARAPAPPGKLPRGASGSLDEEEQSLHLPGPPPQSSSAGGGGERKSASLAPSEMRDLSPYSPIRQLQPGTPSRPQPQHVLEAYSPTNVPSPSGASIVDPSAAGMDPYQAKEEELKSLHKAIRFHICTDERKARRLLVQHLQTLQALSPVKSHTLTTSTSASVGHSSTSRPRVTSQLFDEPAGNVSVIVVARVNKKAELATQQQFVELNTLEQAGRRDTLDYENDSFLKLKETHFMQLKMAQLRHEKELKDISKSLLIDESQARDNIIATATRKNAMYIRSFENGLKRIGS